MTRSIRRTLLFNTLLLTGSFFVGTSAIAQLQTVNSGIQLATQLVDQVTFGNPVMSASDPASAAPELPGLGMKFELFGVMVRDTDPENNVGGSGASGGGVGGNEGISATMTPTSVAIAYRSTTPGIRITAFTNQLGFKHYFVAPRTCGG